MACLFEKYVGDASKFPQEFSLIQVNRDNNVVRGVLPTICSPIFEVTILSVCYLFCIFLVIV